MPVPTQDQLMGQLRLIIPAIGTIVTAVGIAKSDQVGNAIAILMQMVGPISYLIAAIWSLIANNKSSIIKATAGMKETDVKSSPNGTVTITVNDQALANAAKSVPQTTPPKE